MYFAPKHMEIIAAGMATWSYQKTCELIELYEAHPCLYNTKHKEYHDRNLRGAREIGCMKTRNRFARIPKAFSTILRARVSR